MRIDANLAWDAAARHYRGEDTRTNSPLKKPAQGIKGKLTSATSAQV
jgi:hypothetical protein